MTIPCNNDLKILHMHLVVQHTYLWHHGEMRMDVYLKYLNSQCTVIKLLTTTLRVIMSNKMTLLDWKLRKQFVLLKSCAFFQPWFLWHQNDTHLHCMELMWMIMQNQMQKRIGTIKKTLFRKQIQTPIIYTTHCY